MILTAFAGLNPIFKAVKTALAGVTELESIDWYNAQYDDATMLDEVGAFVEFPDEILFEDQSKQQRRSPLIVRVHIYHKLISEVDQHISDIETGEHEAVALKVKDALDYVALTDSTGTLTRKLHFRGWKHWHRFNGWLVTWIDFYTEVTL